MEFLKRERTSDSRTQDQKNEFTGVSATIVASILKKALLKQLLLHLPPRKILLLRIPQIIKILWSRIFNEELKSDPLTIMMLFTSRAHARMRFVTFLYVSVALFLSVVEAKRKNLFIFLWLTNPVLQNGQPDLTFFFTARFNCQNLNGNRSLTSFFRPQCYKLKLLISCQFPVRVINP